jgi:hypothetical protein
LSGGARLTLHCGARRRMIRSFRRLFFLLDHDVMTTDENENENLVVNTYVKKRDVKEN